VHNISGTVVERYTYSPYGELTIMNASFTPISASTIANSYTFTGREYDAETGLFHYRNRYYHAQLGRFISRDPIEYEGSQWNLYEYVASSPVMKTDPTGEVGPAIVGVAFVVYVAWDWAFPDAAATPANKADELEAARVTSRNRDIRAFGKATSTGVILGGGAVAAHGSQIAARTYVTTTAIATHPATGPVTIGVLESAAGIEGPGLPGPDDYVRIVDDVLEGGADAARGMRRCAPAGRVSDNVAGPSSNTVQQNRYWWRGRYSTPASQPGAYQASGGKVFPTRRNSGLGGEALRREQQAFAERRLAEGHPVEVVRGQAREAGLTSLGRNERLADRGAENAIQRALESVEGAVTP
jgi:RHS repeat-associated protein